MNQPVENTALPASQLPRRAFPAEGTSLHKILSDAQFRQSFRARLKRFNPLLVALYKIGLLPLLGVSRTVMLLTTKGRKSGRQRVTPIGYFPIGGVIHLFSAWGKGASWYQNLAANPDEVWIQVGLRKRSVYPQALQEPAEILRTLEQFFAESPAQAHYLFGWEHEQDRMDNADFSTVIDQVLIVRFVEKTQ